MLSATNLAAFMANYDLFKTEIKKNPMTVEWREDFKKVIAFTEDKIYRDIPFVPRRCVYRSPCNYISVRMTYIHGGNTERVILLYRRLVSSSSSAASF